MALKQSISIKQGQRLSMTPQMRQAIEILQLGQLDLQKLVEDEVTKNPLLEVKQPRSSGPSGATAGSDFDPMDLISSEQTLIEYLTAQINVVDTPIQNRDIALRLLGELDENGYLAAPVFELADRLNTDTSAIEAALKVVQSCEPAGIGARNLQECLTLQLIDTNRYDPVMKMVLKNLPLVAKNDTDAIAKIIGEGGPETAEILAEIRQLNPRPASDFTSLPVRETRPDVRVKRSAAGDWRIELISSALPKVLVNHEYAAEIAAHGDEALVFVHNCEQSANWLINALDQRAQTILKTATAIVRHQHAFFDSGSAAMLPLTLSQIADSIQVHESTISRVTNGKYLICERGIFELKYFFVSKILSIDGFHEFSSMEIRSRIKHLIDEENHKKTLSDDRIVNILREDGVDIARRTVAKYREAMSIPSSVVRRKIKSQN